MRVIDAATGVSTPVDQPESPSTVWGGANPEYDSTTLRYEYTSLVTPRSVYDLDLGTGAGTSCSSASRCSATSTRRATGPSGGGPRPTTGPRSRSRWSTGPIMVAGPGAGPAGAPCLLYGYGSYETRSTRPSRRCA